MPGHTERRFDIESREAKKHRVKRFIKCSLRIVGAIYCVLFALLGFYNLSDGSYAVTLYRFSYWFAGSLGYAGLGVVMFIFELLHGPRTALECFATATFYFFSGCASMGEVDSDATLATSGQTWRVLLTIFGMLLWIVAIGRIGIAFVSSSWVYVSEEETHALLV